MVENWEIHWKDYYKILQVHPTAEQEVIKAAFDRLARKYHPDVNKTQLANQRMRDLNEAFEILGSVEKRRRYHPIYLENKRMGDVTNEESQPINIPKPIIEPHLITVADARPGEIKKGTFVIRNSGGPFTTINISKPGPWLKIIPQSPITTTVALPLKVEIEVKGEDWGKSYIENVIVKLDDIETHIRVELHTQPKPAESDNQPIPFKVLDYLKRCNIKYIDKTSKGGAFWLIGGSELAPIISELRKIGISFIFAKQGGRVSSFRPAWFYKKKI